MASVAVGVARREITIFLKDFENLLKYIAIMLGHIFLKVWVWVYQKMFSRFETGWIAYIQLQYQGVYCIQKNKLKSEIRDFPRLFRDLEIFLPWPRKNFF